MSKRPRDSTFPRPKGTGKKMRTTFPAPRRVIANKETGFVDLASANYAYDTTGTITLLATVPQGASVNQRVGKKIRWKSIQCRGINFANTSAVFNDCAMLIVYDKRPTGQLPAITDVLNTVSSRSFNNDANSGRFVILKRHDFNLVGSSTTPTEASTCDADFFLKIDRDVEFAAAGTGAIADISLGALYLITVGQNAAGATAASALLGFRTRFIDM